jgi:hypothetical protein
VLPALIARAMMMESGSISETSVIFYQTALRDDPEDSHFYTCCLEKPKCHRILDAGVGIFG